MNAEVCGLMPGSPPPDPAYASADAAYKALASNDYPLALSQTRAALQKSPGNPAYQLLLVNILSRDKQLEAAEREATLAIDGGNRDPEMLAQRGRVREALGKKEQAEQDYKDVLQLGTASVPLQINMLSRLHERKEASRRYNAAEEAGVFDACRKSNKLTSLHPQVKASAPLACLTRRIRKAACHRQRYRIQPMQH